MDLKNEPNTQIFRTAYPTQGADPRELAGHPVWGANPSQGQISHTTDNFEMPISLQLISLVGKELFHSNFNVNFLIIPFYVESYSSVCYDQKHIYTLITLKIERPSVVTQHCLFIFRAVLHPALALDSQSKRIQDK